MSKTIALVMAAGIGSRIESKTPKQYLKINGQSILRLAIEKFAQHEQIDAIACVIHRDHEHLYYDALRTSQSMPKLLAPIIGGHERQDSVRLGLNALKSIQPQYVLIHDAVRIFFSHISQIIKSLPIYDAVVLGTRTMDTLWQETEKEILPVSRSNVFQIQTPQAFRYDFIFSLHHKYKDKTFTDDLGLVVHDSPEHKVKIIESSSKNFKITTADDLCLAEALIKRPFFELDHGEQKLEAEKSSSSRQTRIGFGFDCHRLEKSFNLDNKIMLCGVPISCDYQVIAHSDGDVALHALTDAILGAISEGDIGIHFPPSDPQWKGKNSDYFLQFAANLLQEKYNGHINNLDLTIVAEIPKIAPHRDAIITSLSRILSINQHQVSIKATTAENLGIVGQKRGIVCYATICVELAGSFLSRLTNF